MTLVHFTAGTIYAVVFGLLPLRAVAQRVSGTVRAADNASVIMGAVVTALDSAGKPVGRTLTGTGGQFSLVVPPAARQLRVIRIGFSPATSVLSDEGKGGAPIDIIMDRLPVVLTTVRVSSDASCGRSDDGRAVMELWEQARSALLAAIVAREANPARIRLLRYERQMEPAQKVIEHQQIGITAATSTRPVAAARTGAALAANGYRERNGSAEIFYAPDADVLFDESFAAMHCFGVTNGTGSHAGQLGLTFAPRKNSARRDLVDVEGTLWMSTHPELIQLDYRYTGVDAAAARAGSGGTMHFRTMSNGVVFIDSWSITTPILAEHRGRGVDGNLVTTSAVTAIGETGGYVLEAAWADGVRWLEPLGGIRGTVREEKTGIPVAGTSVTLGAGPSVETEANGRYSFAPLPPGRYRLAMLDSAYSGYTRPRRQSRVVTLSRGDTLTADFQLPARTAVLSELCRVESRRGGTGILLGRINDGSFTTPSNLRVEGSWVSNTAGGQNIDVNGLRHSVQVAEVKATGHFLICGVPRQTSAITLRASLGRASVADTLLPALGESRIPIEIEWSLPAGTFAAAQQGDGSVFSGNVTRNGSPLAGVEVWIILADTTVTTDSSGRFRIGGLRAGQQIVQFRRSGVEVLRDTVTLRRREETTRTFAMPPTVIFPSTWSATRRSKRQ